MIERVQRGLVLLLILALLAWAWFCLRQHHLTWLLIAPASVYAVYAAFMGIEFALIARWRNDHDDPWSLASELMRAWWRETDIAVRVFCWQQPWRVRRWPDHLPAAVHPRRGLLLVHGYCCNRGLWNPWLQTLHNNGVPFIALTLEPAFGSIDDYADTIEAAVSRLSAHCGLPPIVVAHSMGGLAVRAWWSKALASGPTGLEQTPAQDRIHRLITIGTPHHGTWFARFAFTRNAREMRQNSPWWQSLLTHEPAAHRARTTCAYSACDNVVTPAASAALPGAELVLIRDAGHLDLLDRAEVQALVRRYLVEATSPK